LESHAQREAAAAHATATYCLAAHAARLAAVYDELIA
jgi:hypothetical protein